MIEKCVPGGIRSLVPAIEEAALASRVSRFLGNARKDCAARRVREW